MASVPLMLQVRMNGRDLGVVVLFRQASDGRFSATRASLAAIRLVTGDGDPADQVALDGIVGLSVAYDERQQIMALNIEPARLAAQSLDPWRLETATSSDLNPGRGVLLNYNLFGAAASKGGAATVSAALDGRIYGPLGTFAGSGIVYFNDGRLSGTRLDTRWTRVLPGQNLIAVAGDSITGSTTWSRPIRFGGLQLQKSFTTRPDLVTIPLPSVTGNASVPSALDVYMNGTRVMSSDVAEGNFIVNNLPAVTGGGNARVVLRDLQGRQIETVTPYFVSQRLLRAGFSEFSVEMGVPRLGYGTASADYRGPAFVSATGRRGLNDTVTLDGHVEASSALVLAGVGAAVRTGAVGVVSVALAGSLTKQRSGGLLYFNYEGQWGDFRLVADAARSVGDYLDLAALSVSGIHTDVMLPGEFLGAVLPPRNRERVTVSMPLTQVRGNLSLNYVNERRRGEKSYRVATATFDQSIFGRGSISASLFRDFGSGVTGFFASFGIALGERSRLQVGITRDAGNGLSKSFEVSQSPSAEPGSLGWQVAAVDGPAAVRSAAVTYQTRVGALRGQVTHAAGRQFANLSFDGSLVFDRSLFLAPRIVSGFAVVNAKAPGVPIAFENRAVGRTNARGLLLITDVRAYQVNQVSLDVTALPASMMIVEPRKSFRPMTFDGVRIDFDALAVRDQALLHLVDRNGTDLPAGTTIIINGGEPVVVGFDGLVLAEKVERSNVIDVLGSSSSRCRIRFERAAPSSPSSVIGPLACLVPL
jgi:outer membrane usher protein